MTLFSSFNVHVFESILFNCVFLAVVACLQVLGLCIHVKS
jgi:hypothetical protein